MKEVVKMIKKLLLLLTPMIIAWGLYLVAYNKEDKWFVWDQDKWEFDRDAINEDYRAVVYFEECKSAAEDILLNSPNLEDLLARYLIANTIEGAYRILLTTHCSDEEYARCMRIGSDRGEWLFSQLGKLYNMEGSPIMDKIFISNVRNEEPLSANKQWMNRCVEIELEE
jgi:hypothetical protein